MHAKLEEVIRSGDVTKLEVCHLKSGCIGQFGSCGFAQSFLSESRFFGHGERPSLAIGNAFYACATDVDAQGITASAATAVVMSKSMHQVLAFNVNHPFLFFIRDTKIEGILLAGTVLNPSG